MDFVKLLEPYSEGGLRTIGGQTKWLLKYVPQHAIDYAISNVYKRMETGETFADGDKLDKELLKVAREYEKKDIEDQLRKRIGEYESNLDVEWNKLSKPKKLWQVITGKA